MKTNISIVIVHYDTLERLKSCLSNLHTSDQTFEVIVVNNSASIPENIQKRFPTVTWIQNEVNQGFSRANNQGLQLAKGRWILFLNPDVEITPTSLGELYHFAEKNHFDAVSPSLGSEYSKPVPSFLSLLQEFTPLKKILPSPSDSRTLVGGCVLIRKKVIEAIGGWDERFFLWFEDSDLTHRLMKAGYSLGFSDQKMRHIGGESLKKMPSVVQREVFFHSMDIYIRKHFPHWQVKILNTFVTQRFKKSKLYPVLNTGASWVVPNVQLGLLDDFLQTNLHFFNKNRQLIVVTSHLSPKKIWQLRKMYPDTRFISLEKNKGFSSTVNVGFRVSTTPLIGTLNDDVILNTNSLENLEKTLKPKDGSVNPVIYTINHQIESAGIHVLKRGKAVPLTINLSSVKSVDATNAACVLYSHSALSRTGIFDERFGSYLEDIDLSLRISRAGFVNKVTPRSTIIHLKHQTSKKFGRYKRWLDLKNWWLVLLKNWSLQDLITHLPSILLERCRNVSGFLK